MLTESSLTGLFVNTSYHSRTFYVITVRKSRTLPVRALSGKHKMTISSFDVSEIKLEIVVTFASILLYSMTCATAAFVIKTSFSQVLKFHSQRHDLEGVHRQRYSLTFLFHRFCQLRVLFLQHVHNRNFRGRFKERYFRIRFFAFCLIKS
jgi:hypothetical protein